MYKMYFSKWKGKGIQYSTGSLQFHTPSKWDDAYHFIYRPTEFPRFREMVSGQAYFYSRTP